MSALPASRDCDYTGYKKKYKCNGAAVVCVRCLDQSYCDKEFQLLDWQAHKKTCVKISNNAGGTADAGGSSAISGGGSAAAIAVNPRDSHTIWFNKLLKGCHCGDVSLVRRPIRSGADVRRCPIDGNGCTPYYNGSL